MTEIELRDKISKEFGLDKLISKSRKKAFKEMDEFLAKLRKKNGTTEY